MENSEINPIELIQPRSRNEKITSFLKGGVTRDLIQRLSNLDTKITLSDGKSLKITMEEVKGYIKHEVDYDNKYHPPGYKYNQAIEKYKRRMMLMDKMLNNGDYVGLIKPMLDEAIRHWNIAKKMDALAQNKSTEERQLAEKIYRESVEEEKEISRRERETGKRQEHGIPPFLLEVDGSKDRDQSRIFLAFATVLAKTVSK